MVTLGFLLFCFFSCKAPPSFLEKDYFALLERECSLLPKQGSFYLDPPPSCQEAFDWVLPLEAKYHQAEYAEEKARLYRAFYFLLTRPLALPMEKNIYGMVPAGDLVAPSVLQMRKEHPEMKLNQIFFNYVLNATNEIKIKTDYPSRSGYFNPMTQSIHIAPLSEPNSTIEQVLVDASTLIHEARHSETGPHDTFCKGDTLIPECDKGTDQPHGFQLTYLWSLLQGNELRPHLSMTEMIYVETQIFEETTSLTTLPGEVLLFRDMACDLEEAYKPEGGLRNYFSFRAISQAEQLSTYERQSFFVESDVYKQAMSACKGTPQSFQCEKMMDRLMASSLESSAEGLRSCSTSGDIVENCQSRIRKGFLSLLLNPLILPLEKSVLGLGQAQDLLDPDFLSLFQHNSSMNPNQVLFNYLLKVLPTVPDWSLAYPYFSEPLGEGPSLYLHEISSFFARLPSMSTVSTLSVRELPRWYGSLLWVFLKSNSAATKPFLKPQEVSGLTEVMCEAFRQSSLPIQFSTLKQMSCQDSKILKKWMS